MYRQSAFGALSDGRPAQLFTLDNGLLTLSVTDYGATAVRLTVPDRGGAPTDVLLGYDSAAAYERDDKYLGATVGRCANRIGGAAFTLGGKRYALTANDGANHLHGGRAGFHAKLWTTAALSDSAVAFTLRSPDGDEGYPANLDARVTYSLDGRTLRIAYEVRADGDTLCCLTNHSYFNLSGGREKIYLHRLRLSSSAYLPVGDDCLPLSRDRTAGTRFDFAESRPIGGDYDNSFDVDGFDGRLRAFAELRRDRHLARRPHRPPRLPALHGRVPQRRIRAGRRRLSGNAVPAQRRQHPFRPRPAPARRRNRAFRYRIRLRHVLTPPFPRFGTQKASCICSLSRSALNCPFAKNMEGRKRHKTIKASSDGTDTKATKRLVRQEK